MRTSSLVFLATLLALGCGSSSDTPTPPPSSAPPSAVPPASVATAPGAAGNVLLDTDGALAATDGRMGAMYVDRYTIHADEGQRVHIVVTSSTLDTVLRAGLPGQGTLTNDDHDGSRTESDLDLVARASGDVKISVTTFAPGATGDYHIHAERVLDAPNVAVASVPQFHVLPSNFRSYIAGATPSAPTDTPTAVSVHVGDHVQGSLAAGDATLPSGEFADYYAFDAQHAGRYTISMQSSRLDSFLVVTTPSGERLQNDDSGGSRDASLDIDVSAAGSYRIAATSYRAGETGAYALAVATASSAPSAPTATAPTAPTGPAAPPPSSGAPAGVRTEHGELANGDSTLRSGEFFDEYDYNFTRGTPVHLEAVSSAFDTYLILRSPDGQQSDNDDQQPGDLNAALDFTANQDGQYRVLVTSYAPGMSGGYDLVVNGNAGGPSTPAPPTTGAPTDPTAAPTGPVAAPGDATRVWVVSAGITDYPDPANHLPECANDARKIVEALHNQGLSTTDTEFLLVDRAATVEGIHHAIQTVAQRIQPNDTFVFFWSGHGGQATATRHDDPNELDEHDEFIFVYDGEILDDQMAQWMDSVHGLTLFALDSCFSGGFAKDVVHRPGIVGMFSSEEDVTSGVALQFQAGGYLSHFLRLGIQGGADDDPHDTTTTVGELTHYVWQQWAEHASDVRMSGGYQQLVEERGAVHTDEVFWRLTGGRTSTGTRPSTGRRGGRTR